MTQYLQVHYQLLSRQQSEGGERHVGTQVLITATDIFHYREPEQKMQTILKVICCMIALFVIANGIWVVLTPPLGDEPQGYAIIAVGIFIPLITLYIARMDDRSEA